MPEMFIGIGSVHGPVAVRATSKIGSRLVFLAGCERLDPLIRISGKVAGDGRILGNARADCELVELVVHGMTGDADDGLNGHQHVACDGTMWVVTDLAILGGGWVFVDPGSDHVLVAVGAQLILVAGTNSRVFMGIVAPDARHSSLGDRVMGGVAETCADIRVAFHAEL